MFDVSFSELMVIAIVALVVIGPERLPRVARTTGLLFGRLQRYVNDVKADIGREIQLDELKRLQSEMQASAHSFERSMNEGIQSIEQSVQQTVDSAQAEVQTVAAEMAVEPAAPAAPPVAEDSLPAAAPLPHADAVADPQPASQANKA